MQPILTLCVREGGVPELQPSAAAPRLSAAIQKGMGWGLLDAVKHDLPIHAPRCLYFLREKARHTLVAWLRAKRTNGEATEESWLPSSEEASRWLISMPPICGESIHASDLIRWMQETIEALCAEATKDRISPEMWLSRLGDGWQHIGRLCFHLAENGLDSSGAHPFAFLATFVYQISGDDKPKHLPLGAALRLFKNDRAQLLSLLRPLRQVASTSPFLGNLVDSQKIFSPLVWSPQETWQFLQCIPALQDSGIDVRMVNLWKSSPPRIRLEITAETDHPSSAPAHLSIHSLLRFSPALMLGTHRLSEEELRQLLDGDDGLIRFQGEWISVDRNRLQHLMQEWRKALHMTANGIPLPVGLRYLLGSKDKSLPQLPSPSEDIVPCIGESLNQLLKNWPPPIPELKISSRLASTLRNYQKEGVRFLIGVTEAGFGACLADDMGLGKTLQVIAWLDHLNASEQLPICGVLIVAPASLIGNWKEEIHRFAPHLRVGILHSSVQPYGRGKSIYFPKAQIILTTYDMMTRVPALADRTWVALILDEAQAVKNADSQRSKSAKKISAQRRAALTGTPIENSTRELWSLFDFLTPGLLGSLPDFTEFLKQHGDDYAPLRRLIHPFMLRRLKTDPSLIPELPSKTVTPCFCHLTPNQLRLYRHEVESLQAVIQESDPKTRLMLILPILSRLKQICNHPAQYQGTGYFNPNESGKMQKLRILAQQIAQSGEKTLVFTQYRTMIVPLHDLMAEAYGQSGCILHGGTPVKERQTLIERFQTADGPPFFILSLKAAGTGLTLTRASHVIHFDRWWNPAVENQAGDRAYRIGQTRPVWIHPFVCLGTIEENIHRMLSDKSKLADLLLKQGFEKMLLSLSPNELQSLTMPPASFGDAE